MNFYKTLSKARLIFDGRSVKGLVAGVVWQLANYAVPLLTFPYLARILGVHGFGLVGLATAVMSYALTVCDWGFGMTATLTVAQSHSDHITRNRFIWSVMLAKAILSSCCALLIFASFLFIDKELYSVLVLGLLNLIPAVFTVDWALRGGEAHRSFAGVSVVGRLVTVPLTYLCVRNAGDAGVAMAVVAAGSGVTAILSIYRCKKLGLLSKPVISFNAAMKSISDGRYIFASTAISSLYTNSVTLALGFMSSAEQAGLFSGAERIRRPLQNALSPIHMVFFPRIGALAAEDEARARRLSDAVILCQLAISACLALALFWLSPFAVKLLLGPKFAVSAQVLRLLSIAMGLVGAVNGIGLLGMLPFGMKKEFSRSVSLGALVGIGSVFPLAWLWGAVGGAWAVIAAELTVVLAMLVARHVHRKSKAVKQ